jgi:hypothetical protein
VLLGQEHHADAILTRRGQLDALRRHLGTKVVVGDLDQDAGAVAHQRVGADRAAVVQVLENLQTLRDDRVRLASGDVGDETDAAGIVLVRRRIQSGRRCQVHFAARSHRFLLDFVHALPRLCRQRRRIPQCSISDPDYGRFSRSCRTPERRD